MTITSISSVINTKFLQRIGAATASKSSNPLQGSGSGGVSTALSGLSNGARVFTQAISGMNSLISFINITRKDLQGFKELTTEMIQVVTKATKDGIGQSVRTSLNGKFEDLAITFQKKVAEMSGRKYDGNQKAKVEEIFALLGFDAKSSKSFAELIDQFSFVENESGKAVLASDMSQAKRPIQVPQAALQTTIRNVYANGNGSFYARATTVLTGGASIVSAAAGDSNNDGIDEAAFLDANGIAWVGTKSVDGTFRTTTSVALAAQTASLSVLQFRDVNGDGFDDLLTISGDGDSTAPRYVNVALANGDGTFSDAVSTMLSFGNTHTASAIADFNEDGAADIIQYDSALGTITGSLGSGDGLFLAQFDPISAYVPASGVQAIQAGDIDGDGNQDFVMMHADGFTVVKGNGDGTFAEGVSYTTGDSTVNNEDFALVDINGDGRAEVIFGNRVWINDGLGTYSVGQQLNTGTSGRAFVRDVNNDGFQDIVTLDETGSKIYTAFGNGDGTFQSTISSTLSKVPTSGIIGDFNGDGLTDLLIGNNASGSNSSFTTVDSAPTSVEVAGVKSSGTDFKTLFATKRTILNRPDAYKMLADIKALDAQIDTNLAAIEKAFNYVYDNMKMIRQVGLSFLDAAKEVGQRSLTDPEAITAVLQQKIRSGSKGSLKLLENLENIVAVTLSRTSQQSSS